MTLLLRRSPKLKVKEDFHLPFFTLCVQLYTTVYIASLNAQICARPLSKYAQVHFSIHKALVYVSG